MERTIVHLHPRPPKWCSQDLIPVHGGYSGWWGTGPNVTLTKPSGWGYLDHPDLEMLSSFVLNEAVLLGLAVFPWVAGVSYGQQSLHTIPSGRQLHPYLDWEVFKAITHVLITSCLYYCNAFRNGMQLVQNAAAWQWWACWEMPMQPLLPNMLHCLYSTLPGEFKL